MTYLNDAQYGNLEIKFIQNQTEQIFYGNAQPSPKLGDLIESWGSPKVFIITKIRQFTNDTFQGWCKER